MTDEATTRSERAGGGWTRCGWTGVRREGAGSSLGRAPRRLDPPLDRFRRHLQPGFLEAKREHGSGVAVGSAAGLRAEHDQDELLARAPRRHRQVVAGSAREAGLEGLDAPWIVEERNVPAINPAAIHERGAAQKRARAGIVAEQADRWVGADVGWGRLLTIG